MTSPKPATTLGAQPADADFLRSVLESSADCIKVLDLDGNLIFMSERGQHAMEVSDFNAIRGCPWPDFWQGELSGEARRALETARQGGVGRFQGPATTMKGTPRYWDVQVTPIFGGDGRVVNILSVSRDITESQAAEGARRDARTLNTMILNSTRDCIVVMNLEGFIQFVSPGGLAAMEIDDASSIAGAEWVRVWKGADRKAARAALALAASGGVGRFQGFCPTLKGVPKWWDVLITPVPGTDGRPERLVSAGRDITAAHEAEARERLVMEELNHRVKNTLAVVQAIADQTLRNSASLIEAGKALSARLAALAVATDALVSGDWAQTSMRGLVDNLARLHDARHGTADAGSGRFRVDGPDFMLGPRAVKALALVLHELGTNATKYGALTVPTGVVDVAWALQGAPDAAQRFRLSWSERGGPAVSPPSRVGFGTLLIKRSLDDFGAESRIDYSATGLTFSVEAPSAPFQQG